MALFVLSDLKHDCCPRVMRRRVIRMVCVFPQSVLLLHGREGIYIKRAESAAGGWGTNGVFGTYASPFTIWMERDWRMSPYAQQKV